MKRQPSDYNYWPTEDLYKEALILSKWIGENPGKFDGCAEKYAIIKYIRVILENRNEGPFRL